jgi:beta-lactamase regulating signal transducer with metallopeptidase domain
MEMGRMVMEYCLNAVWLVPVVAAAAWLLVKVAGLRAPAEHRVWLGALSICLLLPGMGIERGHTGVAAGPAPESKPVRGTANSAIAAAARLPKLVSDPAPAGFQPAAAALPLAAPPASRRVWLARRLREIRIDPASAGWFAWGYAAVVGLAAFRMVRVWLAAARLVREASPYAMSAAERALLRELAARFAVAAPRVLSSDRVRSPVVVGAWRTVLLLPPGFARCSDAERRAALCHELAHLRRRDCLVHAGVQALMLPLVWHPGIHVMGRRIARTRELACDGIAAESMSSGADELAYARCLLSLAQRLVSVDRGAMAGVGLGLFRTNKLEERVMRLTEAKRVLTMRELMVRRAGGVAVAGVVLAAGAMVHVAPVVAQQSAPAAPAAPASVSPNAAVPQDAAAAVAAPVVASVPTKPRTAPASAASATSDDSRNSGGEGASIGVGSSGTVSGTAELAGGIDQNDEAEHVMQKDGNIVHRWVGADGERYEVRDAQVAPYTKQQERAAEAEFKRRMAEADASIAKVRKQLDSTEFKAQLDSIASGRAAAALAQAQEQIARETARLTSPHFKAQIDALQAQIDTKAFRDRIDQLTSAQVEAKLAEAERQAALVDSPQMQAQMQTQMQAQMEKKLDDAAKRLDEASARLEAATKALAEARKRLQETPKQ